MHSNTVVLTQLTATEKPRAITESESDFNLNFPHCTVLFFVFFVYKQKKRHLIKRHCRNCFCAITGIAAFIINCYSLVPKNPILLN
jgi:hypothetical protein